MKLKLDLHPIHSDSDRIEAALRAVIDEACDKRASSVEIIPGKGSGALKKSVLRFLDRPEVRARYHRIEKDSENWGRLFVHFRWDRSAAQRTATRVAPGAALSAPCFCCRAAIGLTSADEAAVVECPSCGSPNRLTLLRGGRVHLASGYE